MTTRQGNPYTRLRPESADELLATLRERYGAAMEDFVSDPRPEKWHRLVTVHSAYCVAAFCEDNGTDDR